MQRIGWLTLAALTALAHLPSPALAAAGGPKRPNILLLTTDEHHAEALGMAGHPTLRTPWLDHLAREGIHFRGAYTVAPECTPARATWYTGRYPQFHGAIHNAQTDRSFGLLPDEVATALPAVLRRAGYRTGFIGKLHIFPFTGWFDDLFLVGSDGWIGDPATCTPTRNLYREYLEEAVPALRRLPENASDAFAPGGAVITYPWKVGESVVPNEHHEIRWKGDRAVEFLRSVEGSSAPWFLHLSFNKPHTEFVVPAPYSSLYDPEEVPIPPSFTDRTGQRNTRERVASESVLRKIRSHYYGAITFVDWVLGRVLAELERLEMAEETIVVFTADHGGMNGEHNRVTKGVMFEAAVRVPLIIRLPGKPRGEVVEEIFDSTSLMPTLLDLAGLPIPGRVQGRSLAALLDGQDPEWENVAFAVLRDRMVVKRVRLGGVDRDFKLIRPENPYPSWGIRAGGHSEPALYEVSSDRWEVENRIGDPAYAAVRADLEATLASWWGREDVIEVAVADSFALDGETRVAGSPLVGTRTEHGDRLWEGDAGAVLSGSTNPHATNVRRTDPLAAFAFDPEEAQGRLISIEADVNVSREDGAWAAVGFLSGARRIWGSGQLWMSVRRDGRVAVRANGLDVAVSEPGAGVEVVDAATPKRLVLQYGSGDHRVSAWVNGVPVVEGFELGGLYRPSITHVGFASHLRSGQSEPRGSIQIDNLRVIFGPYTPGVVPIPRPAPSPVPADRGEEVPTADALLAWGSSPGASGFDVYLGTGPASLELLHRGLRGRQLDPGQLEAGTTYYWRVDAVNGLHRTPGCLWSFTTAVAAR